MADVRELAALIDQNTRVDGISSTAIPRVVLYRLSRVSESLHTVYQPCVCFVAQGRKEAVAGGGVHVYDSEHFLIVSVDIPVQARVLDARPDRPLLALRLDVDPSVLGALVLEGAAPRAHRDKPEPALAVSPVTPELLDACIRLLRLLGSPRDIPVLASLVERELLYRLLQSDQGSRLARIAQVERDNSRSTGRSSGSSATSGRR
jgi:hypothetical protein